MSHVRRPPEDEAGDRPPSTASQLGQYGGFGLTIAASTALFTWLGSLLDERLGTKPLFVLIGAFSGFAGGFYAMYWRLVLKDQAAAEEKSRDERES